jgi:hypothetical protein
MPCAFNNIELQSAYLEHFSDLRLGNAASPQFLEREPLERAAREIATAVYNPARDFIGNLEVHLHRKLPKPLFPA